MANNKDEIFRICYELSKEVSKELKEEGLEAQKVSIKIKTTNFEVFSRTKSLSAYSSEISVIFQAAKMLLINEWNASGGKLRLRLIGVRVSYLKDLNLILNASVVSTSMNKINSKISKAATSGMKTLDNFFQKKTDSEKQFDAGKSLGLVHYFEVLCPHCSIRFECNIEFYIQHLDACVGDLG